MRSAVYAAREGVMSVMQLVCDSGSIDATTGVCSAPQWVPLQTLLPPLDAGAGIAISIAVLSVWAIAYGFVAMRRAGD